MNIKTSIFIPGYASKEIFPLILKSGTEVLQRSNKMEKFGLSLREVFGLCILSAFRKEKNPEKNWVFMAKSQQFDDGAVAVFDNNENRVVYYEMIEQVYFPGRFLERDNAQNMNDTLLSYISKTKNKGEEYQKDTSLLILNDIASNNCNDCFEWKDFVQKFFMQNNFLHLYFVSLINHTSDYNKYYLLSFTFQKHRQSLNGEFTFKMNNTCLYDFECLQEINLLKGGKNN